MNGREMSEGAGERGSKGNDQQGDASTSEMTNPQNATTRETAAPANEREARFAGLLSPADKVVIGYVAIIAALILIFSHRIPHWPQLIIGHALAVAVVVLIAKLGQFAHSSPDARVSASVRQRIVALARGWYPVALIPITYKELSYLIPLIHPRDYDTEMARIDRWMFGVDPTVWLERITQPLLTDILQISYATYYFLPIILGAVLWRKGWFDRFHFFVYIIALGFYTSYIGYISVPVIGPRFLAEIKNAQSFPLSGFLLGGELFRSIRETLDRAEGITRDCFPSGHTELTLLVLYYARKFHLRTFWWLLPAGSALILSTVYLRYHYVIDVLAGAVFALAVILVAKPLYRLLGGRVQWSGIRGQ